jgi:hypothetical protein
MTVPVQAVDSGALAAKARVAKPFVAGRQA